MPATLGTRVRAEEARESAAGVAERNAIRRALRCEAAWRRRRSVVLLKASLENKLKKKQQPPQQRQQAEEEAASGTWEGIPLPNDGGSGSDGGDHAGGGRIKRKERTDGESFLPPSARSEKAAATAEARRGRIPDDSQVLRRVLEGVVDLAGREEALFRQILLFL